MLRLIALVAIGAAAGFVCARAGAPLPWMLGPLFVTAAAALAGVAPPVPVRIRYSGQLLVATAVAMNVTPAALQTIAAHLPLMLVCAVAAISFAMLLALVISRLSTVEISTVFFASLPGGPIEMATLTERYGGNPSVVVFGQTMRLAAVVTVVPAALIFSGVPFIDVARDFTFSPLAGPAGAVLLALAASSGLHQAGLANAFFIGPLMSVGLATAVGAPFGVMPGIVTAGAQVALGLALGAMFRPSIIFASRDVLLTSISIVLLLLSFGFAIAYVISSMSAVPFPLLALGNAPGSVAEMALAAKGMSLDSALVTSYHLVRIAIVVPFAEIIFRALRSIDFSLR